MAFYDEPQWCVVGDTFPVGCEPQPSIVYGKESFKNNPDLQDSTYWYYDFQKTVFFQCYQIYFEFLVQSLEFMNPIVDWTML